MATLFRNSAVMGTGECDDNSVDDRVGFHFSLPFFLFFLSSHQHRENHEQCGHAKAYSTVMLRGNSQESNMPSCQSGLERNMNRSTVVTTVTFFFVFQNHFKSHSIGQPPKPPPITCLRFFFESYMFPVVSDKALQ